VVYSDWLRGYGLLLIVDHGEGYLSLYAYNESLYKDVGDWVERGESVASVGASGGQAKAGLYFSIRKNGKPVNPVHWCKAVNKGRVG
jgi:septal ring factor EnvC (AmiA/AmiB activator)